MNKNCLVYVNIRRMYDGPIISDKIISIHHEKDVALKVREREIKYAEKNGIKNICFPVEEWVVCDDYDDD